jgi:hypothetical protein
VPAVFFQGRETIPFSESAFQLQQQPLLNRSSRFCKLIDPKKSSQLAFSCPHGIVGK